MFSTAALFCAALFLAGGLGGHVAAASAPLTVNTPISALAANPQSKAVLQHDVPGLLTNPQYPMFSSMSLAQVAGLSDGKLSQRTLRQVQKDLAKIKFGG